MFRLPKSAAPLSLLLLLIPALAVVGCGPPRPRNPPPVPPAPPAPVITPEPVSPTPAAGEASPGTPVASYSALPPYREQAVPDAPGGEKSTDRFVFVEEVNPYADGNLESVSPLLVAQLYRQGVLLAARDELGLIARDEVIGEVPPPDLPAGNRLRVRVTSEPKRERELVVQHGAASKSRTVWRAVADAHPHDEAMSDALGTAEQLSRGGFVTALKAAGFDGSANRRSDAVVPDHLKGRCEQMMFPVQFGVIRDVHAAIREKGESPALLVELVRGYAHLGILTDRHWDGSTWAYKARSLLYAERLARRYPDSPWGYWARGYAEACAGYAARAVEDFGRAEQRRKGLAVPAWVELANALARGESAKLEARFADTQTGELAVLFHLLTCENPLTPTYTTGVVKAAADRWIGGCYRVYDTVLFDCGLAFIRWGIEVSTERLNRSCGADVALIPDVPKGVKDLGPKPGLPELGEALTAAGRGRDDTSPLSWATLARYQREVRFTQVLAKLNLQRRVLGVSTRETAVAAAEVVGGHPLAPFVASYQFDPARESGRYDDLLRRVPITYLTFRHAVLYEAVHAVRGEAIDRLVVRHAGDNYTDHTFHLRGAAAESRLAVARPTLAINPYSPLARMTLIESGEEVPPDWEVDASHPGVLFAFAARALRNKDLTSAESLLRRAIALSPEADTYHTLANVYQAQGKEDKMLEVLNELLSQPDVGLSHTNVRIRIANHFMMKKDFDSAWPYAEEAATRGGSGAAMICAARCAEGRKDLDEAEAWVKRLSIRYAANARHIWFMFCVRTGRDGEGDARKHLEATIPPPARRTDEDRFMQAILDWANGNRTEAAEYLEAYHRQMKDDFFALCAAAEFDYAGNAEGRDRAMGGLLGTKQYAGIVKRLKAAYASADKQVPSDAELTEFLDDCLKRAEVNSAYFLGRYLQKRKEVKLARKCYELCIRFKEPGQLTPMMAGVLLREMDRKD